MAARFEVGGGKPLPYVFLLAAASTLLAQDRVIPFWPDEVPAAIHAEVDGVAALETVRELGRFHRVQGSPGFTAAAELIRQKAIAAGLSDASIEHFPADGKTKYAHFLSHVGWTPVSATLEEVKPTPRLIASFPDLPVSLADYSQDADVTAQLVDVGAGTSPKDYEGRDVRGKIVLADGPLPIVHRLACEERGAAGFLSDFPNQVTPWAGDDRDLIRWGHLSPYQLQNRFAFMISKRQAAELRERFAGGAPIVLRARVAAKMVPATYDVVVATIPGSDPKAGEVVVTAHLCHESAGANDNASGSAAILEVARALSGAISRQDASAGPRARSASCGFPRSRARRPISSGTPKSWRAWSAAFTWTWSAAFFRRRRAPFTSRAPPRRSPTSPTSSPRPGSTRSSPRRRAMPRA